MAAAAAVVAAAVAAEAAEAAEAAAEAAVEEPRAQTAPKATPRRRCGLHLVPASLSTPIASALPSSALRTFMEAGWALRTGL